MASRFYQSVALLLAVALGGCASPGSPSAEAVSGAAVGQDPDLAEQATVDRFSDVAGTYFRRSQNDQLPGPNGPIDLDLAPYSLTALAPDGTRVALYDLDAHGTAPANLYIFQAPDGKPLTEQLYVFDALPGEPGYNDFCAIQRVTVPAAYVPNSITARRDLEARVGEGFKIENTGRILDMPVVPAGSHGTHSTSGGQALLVRGWCRHQVLHYFAFDEVTATPNGQVPTTPMYAFFSDNASNHRAGFRTTDEVGSSRNVLATLPGSASYSPLWSLMRLAQDDFTAVSSLADVPARLSAPPQAYGSSLNAVVVK